MAYTVPSDETLRNILQKTRTIAVVGASSKPDRASYGIIAKLLRAGYQVIPVNPNELEVQGQRAYPSLLEVPVPVDLVDVFRRSETTPPIAEQAVTIGAKVLWLQLGIENDEAFERASSGGLTVVMNACIGVEHSRLRIPTKATHP